VGDFFFFFLLKNSEKENCTKEERKNCEKRKGFRHTSEESSG
jgi:hypothetical protein